ncbi:hypothetical protein CFOL_v3_31160 [Cephalotus follicularis]|uniref:Uncharacterized protein n=1 Tax=Cephalotus follicularis TaxID=3775 RepID=A0A1Q3D5M7_CEPFO|nr:hypothetical protein CFOL_v3_31160 [Cephalotus follicularis]
MDDKELILGSNTGIEDMSWLCSLSESELGMLISLKVLVLQRAKIVGHDELAKKFDLKMLRALGFVLMQYVKGQVKDLSLSPSLAESATLIDNCNLLKSELENIMSIEELKACISTDSRKRSAKRRSDFQNKWES